MSYYYPLVVVSYVGWGYKVPDHYAWWMVTKSGNVFSSGEGVRNIYLVEAVCHGMVFEV